MLTDKPEFILSDPMLITSRLMPGVQIAEGTLSAEPHLLEGNGRAHFRLYLDVPGIGTWASDDSYVTCVQPDWTEAAADALDVFCDVIDVEDDNPIYGDLEPLMQGWVRDNAIEFAIAHEELERWLRDRA